MTTGPGRPRPLLVTRTERCGYCLTDTIVVIVEQLLITCGERRVPRCPPATGAWRET
jgi:hypothetical protein